jgi:hypothetical protein
MATGRIWSSVNKGETIPRTIWQRYIIVMVRKK